MQGLVRYQRLAHRLARTRATRPLARLIEIAIRLLYSCHLPSGAKIAGTVHFEHGGLGVLVNSMSVICDDCRIGPGVVLGGRAPIRGAPFLEPFVVVHSGAKIIGPVRIGAGSVIGANAVVIGDVPPNSLAVGVPARIMEKPPAGGDF